MKLLPIRGLNKELRKTFVIGYSKVNNTDYKKYSKFKWSLRGRCDYPKYVHNDTIGVLHRLITNCPKGMEVDHKNGDRLDNRKGNLRICTHSENTMNRTVFKNSIYKNKCISWSKIHKKWVVRVQKEKIRYCVGWFKNLKSAIKARNEAIKKYHGEFARL